MFEVGQIIIDKTAQGEEHYIVIETNGHRPILEKLDEFIMRHYVVRDQNGSCYTIKELVNREKYKAISRGEWDVPSY